MPQLPLVVWISAAGLALLLLGLSAATAWAVLRATARERVGAWPTRWILALFGAAVVPWLVVWLAPLRVAMRIHGVGPLIGWLLVALLAFALLVLLPLAAILIGVVWGVARWHRRSTVPSAP